MSAKKWSGIATWDELPPKLRNFERAFNSGSGGCRRECACGRQFYTTDTGYHWDEGELEALAADPDAVAREWSIGTVILGGVEYVTDCKCWHAPALKCIEWMDENAYQVAEYLSLEKKRKQDEADRSPLVGVLSSPTIGEDVRHRINP